MEAFDSEFTQRVIFGENTLEKLPELTEDFGIKRVLLVTDAGIVQAGIAARAIDVLETASVRVSVFSQVAPNPTTQHVEAAVAFARTNAPIELIIGLGGGSAMDCAKGVNFLLTNGGKMEDYWGVNRATQPMLPSIGIPTTTGTGSEAQSFALIAQAETHIKMACGDKKAIFNVVILDPTLTASLPKSVAAATGIDAIAHAIESFVSTKRNPMSQMFGERAWQVLAANFEQSLGATPHLARGNMLFGAYLAGAAIEHSMLGAAHACANPLTANYGITHGLAVGLMLPHVILYNSKSVGELYSQLYPDGDLAACIVKFKQRAELPSRLRDFNIPACQIPPLAAEAAAQWTAQFNPRPLETQDFVSLYEAAY